MSSPDPLLRPYQFKHLTSRNRIMTTSHEPVHALGQELLDAGGLPLAPQGGCAQAFPKQIEDWDIERIICDYADAAERMQAAGLDGLALEAYGHLMDPSCRR